MSDINLDDARATREEAQGEPRGVIFGGERFELPLRAPIGMVEHLGRYFALEREERRSKDKRTGAAALDALWLRRIVSLVSGALPEVVQRMCQKVCKIIENSICRFLSLYSSAMTGALSGGPVPVRRSFQFPFANIRSTKPDPEASS